MRECGSGSLFGRVIRIEQTTNIHLKNAVFAAFKEHDEENSENEDDAAEEEDDDPFGINDILGNNNGANNTMHQDTEADFAIFLIIGHFSKPLTLKLQPGNGSP